MDRNYKRIVLLARSCLSCLTAVTNLAINAMGAYENATASTEKSSTVGWNNEVLKNQVRLCRDGKCKYGKMKYD